MHPVVFRGSGCVQHLAVIVLFTPKAPLFDALAIQFQAVVQITCFMIRRDDLIKGEIGWFCAEQKEKVVVR